MPAKRTAKYIGFSLVSLSITTLLLTGIHLFKVHAENIYNVTKIAKGLTINGDDTVNENTDYSFTLTKSDPMGELTTAFVDIQNAQHANFNTKELSLTPRILPKANGGSTSPKVTLVQDTDSPLMDAGGYKRILTRSDSTEAGSYFFHRFQTNAFWSPQPNTFSMGFWIKDESIANVIQDKKLNIYAFYQPTSPYRIISISVPIQALANDPNEPVTITPYMYNVGDMFESCEADAVCLHQVNGWSYFVVNVKNIVYKEGFTAEPTTQTYLEFNQFASNFNQPGVQLEITGITMTNESITNGYVTYPDIIGNNYKMYLFPKDQTDFTVPGQYIYGDMTITAHLKDTVPPLITGVSDNQIIDLVNNPEGVTPNTSDTDIQTVTLTQNSATVSGYQLGQSLTAIGSYILTVTDDSANTTTISFSIINSKRATYITLNGTNLYVRTVYDDTQDLVQVVTNVTSDAWFGDMNKVVDFGRVDLIGKDTPTTTNGVFLGYSGDDAAPLHFNNSYIGGNHGQSAGTQIVSSGTHGKTYQDIGSVWVDSNGKKFYLIRIVDAYVLLFLTDNTGTHARYSFDGSITGNLTHFSGAVNTSDITVGSVSPSAQIRPAVSNRSINISCYLNGTKTTITNDVTDKLCDYVDIDEKYSIVNPSYIVETIVNNKPVGGYTSNPDITTSGQSILDYTMTHRIQSDGTVLEIFKHKILENVHFNYYGGLQYTLRNNAYGKQYRYIPGTKPFTVNSVVYNLAVPFDIVTKSFPNAILRSEAWESVDLVPDRQIDYYRDDTDQDILAFSTGYLPLDGGTLSARANNVSGAINIATTKKSYPRFIDSKAFEGTSAQNYEIKGIAYRKYFNTKEDTNSLGSIYTIDHEGYTYAYLDFFSFGETQVYLSPELAGNNAELVYKSENVSYTINDTGIAVNAVDRDLGNGYLALKIDNRKNRTISFNNEGTITTSVVLDGNTVARPTDPVKVGYTFKGWYTEDTFDNLFDFNTPIYADYMLYAKFEIIPVTPPITPPVTPPVTPPTTILDPKPVVKPINPFTKYLNPLVEHQETTSSTEEKEEDKSETSETVRKLTTPTLYKGLRVKVYDKEKKPIKGARVEIHSKVRTEITDENGEAYFKNVEVGKHTMIISYKGQKDERTIDLTNDNEEEAEIEINVQLEKESKPNYWLIGMIVILVILIGYAIFKKKKETPLPSRNFSPSCSLHYPTHQKRCLHNPCICT